MTSLCLALIVNILFLNFSRIEIEHPNTSLRMLQLKLTTLTHWRACVKNNIKHAPKRGSSLEGKEGKKKKKKKLFIHSCLCIKLIIYLSIYLSIFLLNNIPTTTTLNILFCVTFYLKLFNIISIYCISHFFQQRSSCLNITKNWHGYFIKMYINVENI